MSITKQKWNKFGDAIEDGKGVNQSTTQTADEVYLSLTSNREVCKCCSCVSTSLFSVSRATRR